MLCTERSQHIQDQWESKDRGKDERSDHRNLMSYLVCPLRGNIFAFRKRWKYLELQRKGKQHRGLNPSGREYRAHVWG